MVKSAPLDILRKGLLNLRRSIEERKSELQSRLADQKSISLEDEQWLDTDANLVDEEQALDQLERASDYERGLSGLESPLRDAVVRLREFAGDLKRVADKKRKRTCFVISRSLPRF
jgi:hypothetical protein